MGRCTCELSVTKQVNSVYWMIALGITSDEAVLLVVDVITVDTLAKEMSLLYYAKRTGGAHRTQECENVRVEGSLATQVRSVFESSVDTEAHF